MIEEKQIHFLTEKFKREVEKRESPKGGVYIVSNNVFSEDELQLLTQLKAILPNTLTVFSREVEIIRFTEDQVVFECDFWFHIQKMLIEEYGAGETMEVIALLNSFKREEKRNIEIFHNRYIELNTILDKIKNGTKIWKFLGHHADIKGNDYEININYQQLNCIPTWM